jgi:hypothetical protein
VWKLCGAEPTSLPLKPKFSTIAFAGGLTGDPATKETKPMEEET